MSEPKTVAERVEEVVPGVWHWRIHDERINFTSAAYAFASDEGSVFVDPLPLADEPLAGFAEPAAVVLSCGSHQRSAWRLRRDLQVRVWAPALSKEIDEEPDERYSDGDELPGGLRAVFTPGAGTTQHTLLLEEKDVAFVPDLLLQMPDGSVALVSDEYLHDPALARESVRKLLELPFSVACLTHGSPLTDGAKASIERALAQAS